MEKRSATDFYCTATWADAETPVADLLRRIDAPARIVLPAKAGL
jgi:hypothetical protein